MQTCSACNAQSPDAATNCLKCDADLSKNSMTAVSLKKFRENPRVRDVRLVISENACPVCATYEGTYTKNEVPTVPIEGCSHPEGCRCFYEPMLTEIYP